jgi:PhnB protein
MKLVHVYLNFPGHTEDAFNHYAKVFGTKIMMLTRFGDAPFMGPVPDAAKAKVLHVQLPITDTVHLMGSDAVDGLSPRPLVAGNNFSISVVADDQAEADRVFAALADGGAVTMALANAPWGPYYGMCVDRYGVQWMVSLTGPA